MMILDARTASVHFPGIGRYVVNLARALLATAPELPLTLLYDPTAPTRLTLPPAPRIAYPWSPFALSQQWRLPRLLRRLGAQLYHSPYYLMPYRLSLPVVVTCYDLIPLIWPQFFSPGQRLLYRLMHWLALAAAHTVLAISETTRADLIRYLRLDPRRCVVTPLAADPAFTPQEPASVARVRQRYGLPENYVLYCGSNKPHKNLPRLVRAFAALPPTTPPLVIAGHWDRRYPQSQRLAVAIGLAGRVKFIGAPPEEDLAALYSGATVFVFPSLYEGFGLPVLEAMACGAPVICAHTSSLPEVAGEAALFFDPCDETALTQALATVLQDADWRDELRTRGLRRAAQFDWQTTAALTAAVYRNVIVR